MVWMNSDAFVHYFSETEVEEAPQLAQSRQQRHYALSKTGPTQCYFLVPYSDHFAEVNISVSATRSKHARHGSYEVLAFYQGCCSITAEPTVDEQIRRTIQIVYDTYVQAVRLELDTHCCERRPREEGESITCQEKKQRFLRSLRTPQHEQNDVENHQHRVVSVTELPRITAAVVAQPLRHSPRRGGKRQRVVEKKGKQLCTAKATVGQYQNDKSLGKTAQPLRKRKNTCQDLATVLVLVAQKGLNKLKLKQKPKQQREHEDEMQSIISRRTKDKLSDKVEVDALLEELEAQFKAREGKEKGKANPKIWHNWYYSACLRVILHSRGKGDNDRRGRGVKLLHQIVNRVAVHQGAKALLVIRAYAEMDCRLCPASRMNAQQQETIIDLLVEALCPILAKHGEEEEEEEEARTEEDEEEEEEEARTEEDEEGEERIGAEGGEEAGTEEGEEEGQVPLPAAWISSVTGISYREVCTILQIPNFSVFFTGYEVELAESFSYSTAVGLWSTFAEKIPQLQMEIEACPPPNWERLADVSKFSWLVSKYCEPAQSSSPSPSESHARLADDAEASTSSIEAHSDPASSQSSPSSARPGTTRLSGARIADVAFSHSMELSSTEPYIAVLATRDGDWSRSNTPAISDSGQEAELIRTSWPTDADLEFLDNLWGDGLDFVPGEGDRMEYGQLDCWRICR